MLNIKLLTLNLHCLEEENVYLKQNTIVKEIIDKNIDVIFLQEVAQYEDSPLLYGNVKQSNYGYELQQLLKQEGKEYFYYFDPIKYSFDKYDEGVAILCKFGLHDVTGNYVSKTHDYNYWRTRKMLKGDLHLPNFKISLISTHLGWTDAYEVFENQVERMLSHVDKTDILIIGGDFNVSPETLQYEYILDSGLHDLYGSDLERIYDATHIKDMDLHHGETRIDYIFSNKKLEVLEQKILFKEDRVSDHYGVYIKLKL